MKSLLNRRSVSLATSSSHFIPADDDAGTVSAKDDESLSNIAPASSAEQSHSVAQLRAVAGLPPHIGGRTVQVADLVEIERLITEQALTPFRVFASFDYSLSLLFYRKELEYYVTLHQDGSLWRALKASDLDCAEAAFHHFEEQVVRLSDGEIRRAQIEAQNEQLAQMIAQAEAQAERIRDNLQRNATHEQIATTRQHQVRKEVAQIEAQRVAARAHLNRALRQIHQLTLASNEGGPHLPSR